MGDDKGNNRDRGDIQEGEYEFPYHHIPHFDGGAGVRFRFLRWGMEYLCYLTHIREMVWKIAPASVLEVGCGDGRFLGMLGEGEGRPRDLTGVDISGRAIGFAKAFHPDLRFLAAPAESLDEEFDVVICIEVLEHIPDEGVGGFLRTLEARTRPGGTVILSVPSSNLPVLAKHFRHYDGPTFERELADSGAGLVLEGTEYVYFEDRLMRLYHRLMLNRFWFLEIWPIRRRMWRHVMGKLRVATSRTGHHVVFRLRRAEA